MVVPIGGARERRKETMDDDGSTGRRGAPVELLTVSEVAALLRLTPKGVYALVEGRRIPFIRVSNRLRFVLTDVTRWIQENRVPAVER